MSTDLCSHAGQYLSLSRPIQSESFLIHMLNDVFISMYCGLFVRENKLFEYIDLSSGKLEIFGNHVSPNLVILVLQRIKTVK